MENKSKPESKVIRYLVNAEVFETTEHKLTVGFILEEAGCTPPTAYRLIRDNGGKEFEDPKDEIPMHEGETFTAIYKDPTPTS